MSQLIKATAIFGAGLLAGVILGFEGSQLSIPYARTLDVERTQLLLTAILGLATFSVSIVAFAVPAAQRREDRRREDRVVTALYSEALKATWVGARAVRDGGTLQLQIADAIEQKTAPPMPGRPIPDALDWARAPIEYFLSRDIANLGIVQGLAAVNYELKRAHGFVDQINSLDISSPDRAKAFKNLRLIVSEAPVLMKLTQSTGSLLNIDVGELVKTDTIAMSKAMRRR